MRIYVAGPYSAPSANDVLLNVAFARNAATELWVLGHEAYCPHAATHDIDAEARVDFGHTIPYERWLAFDIGILEAWAEALYVIAESPGVMREIDAATRKGIPIYRSMADVPNAGGGA